MDAGAPMPAVYSDETGLTCAYVIGATHSESGPRRFCTLKAFYITQWATRMMRF